MARSKFLGRDAILKAKLSTEEIYVAEWDGTVLLRPITVRIRARILDAIDERQKLVDAYEADQALPADERTGVAKAHPLDNTIVSVIMAIVGDDHEPIFSIEEDYEAFADLPLPTLQMLFGALMSMQRREKFTGSEQKKS